VRERTGFRRARLVAAFALGSALTACSGSFEQFSAEDDSGKPADTNVMKSIMAGVGAIDSEEKPIEYKPRAPLVMPPKKDLRTPENADAALASKRFPVNPEDRRVASAGNLGEGGSGISVVDQEKFANLPKSRPVKGAPVYDENQSKSLSPDVMARGHGGAVKEAQAQAASGPYKRRTLTDPPDTYAKPNPNAPFEEEKAKETSWKPSWWPL
jgi:hypothetical protein